MRLATDDATGDCDRVPGADVTGHCADVMNDVWRFLDDELDPARRAAVQRHLDGCSPCLEEAGIDTKLKALLARKCGGDRAPEQLRRRIATKLVAWSEEEGEAAAVVASTTSDVDRTIPGLRE